MLGEFEYTILCAVNQLAGEAFGAQIATLVESQTGRRCSVGALYTTLDRLEAKGLLRSSEQPGTPERGNRKRRLLELTPNGIEAARDFHARIRAISQNTAWSQA